MRPHTASMITCLSLVLLSLALVLGHGCGQTSDHNRRLAPTSSAATSAPATPFVTPAGYAPISLNGTWKQSGCNQDEILTDYDMIESYTFDANVFTRTSLYFGEGQCSSTSTTGKALEIKLSGTFSLTGPLSTPTDTSAFDAIVTQATMTPHDATLAGDLARLQFCGISSWTAGLAVSVSGKSCTFVKASGTPVVLDFSHQRAYDVTKSVAGNLYFGKRSPGREGLAPGARPLVLGTAFTRE